MTIGRWSRILKYLNKIKDKFFVFGCVFELCIKGYRDANFLIDKVVSDCNLITSLIRTKAMLAERVPTKLLQMMISKLEA